MGVKGWFALDVCFLKSPNQGEILTTIGRDRNNHIYPIAWGIVNVENKDNWSWFLELLGADLDMPTGQGLTLMSDQHKGLIEVVKKVMQDAEHMQGCEAVENGFNECFNSVLVSVRNKPLLTMLEAIRVIVLERINTMRTISATWTDDICPSILKRIDLMKNDTRFWHVIPAGGDSFEVRSDSDAFKVDLSTRTCSHKMSQLSGLPCVHAISVIFKINRVPKDYVQNWFRKHLYYATYHNYLSPVGGIDLWHNQSQYLKVLPPKHKTMLGRPKKKRIRIGHEGGSGTRVSKVSGQVTCQNCFQVDHNKRGCNASHVQKPVREKKKAGRPRKGDATDVVGFANPLGGSASGVGRSANPLCGSASGVGRFVNPLGRSASGLGSFANPLSGSATNFDRNASDVGGSGRGVGGVRGSDILRLKWSLPHRRAFNRVGGISFSTRPTGSQQNRPRQQKVRKGFARWFGNDDRGGVKVEIPTQGEIPCQATNDVPPEVQRVRQQRPIVPRQRLPSERIMKRKLARKVHGEGSSQETAMHLD
ncbi:pentatricopeptide repeat-containing protein [Tanacetum coccineum]